MYQAVCRACSGPLGNRIYVQNNLYQSCLLASRPVRSPRSGCLDDFLGERDGFSVVTNIYVGNLPYSTQEDELVEHFSQWGQVERATLVFDRETGRPRGFGFVEMIEPEAAKKAIEEAHGEAFQGRPLTVNEARPRGTGSRGSNLSVSSQIGSRGYNSSESSAGSNGYGNASPSPTPQAPRSSEQAPKSSGGGGYSNYLYSKH